MAWTFYNTAKTKIGNGTIDLDTDTFYIMLLTNVYTPDIDVDDFRNDIEANEASGTGYTAAGQALTTVTFTQDNTNDRAIWDADNPQWTGTTITFRIAVIYKSNGGASSADELVCYNDFGSDQSVTAGTLDVTFDAATGIATLN